MHEEGIGVDRDLVHAHTLFKIAAEHGHSDAQQHQLFVEQQLSC